MDAFIEKEEEIEREYRRHLSARRRRRMFCRHLCGGRRARAHYCIINATVPVLQRFFANEDTRPDFRLGREASQQLLVALKTERHHGWPL
ncbi:Retinoblastoma-related protein 1 [Dissostichus eleginoides]|uniref:Retinoblastoma-related protein 1 n=1 Tax=Dissostichus eleginoides TaxID=100907 RepID=A0AAD9EXH1_DISEL|nr:Retinoblastoma-related protein 1 [Dissostichus eleginoides]